MLAYDQETLSFNLEPRRHGRRDVDAKASLYVNDDAPLVTDDFSFPTTSSTRHRGKLEPVVDSNDASADVAAVVDVKREEPTLSLSTGNDFHLVSCATSEDDRESSIFDYFCATCSQY